MQKISIAIYSGSGIGLLIGVLMGLAISPTVGLIIGALASILAVLLGLNDAQFSDAKAIRIGSFGFACVLGAFLGIFIRAHNFLSPSPADLLKTYKVLGYEKEQVLDFIAYKEFGILDEKWKMADTQIVASAGSSDDEGSSTKTTITGSLTRSSHASVLFSADVNLSSCTNLEDLGELIASEVANNFRKEEGIWAELAVLAGSNLNAASTKPFLLAVRDGICAKSSGKIDDASCATLNDYSRDVDFKVIRDGFAASPGVWRSLAESIGKTDMDEAEKARALWIVNTTLCKPEKKT